MSVSLSGPYINVLFQCSSFSFHFFSPFASFSLRSVFAYGNVGYLCQLFCTLILVFPFFFFVLLIFLCLVNTGLMSMFEYKTALLFRLVENSVHSRSVYSPVNLCQRGHSSGERADCGLSGGNCRPAVFIQGEWQGSRKTSSGESMIACFMCHNHIGSIVQDLRHLQLCCVSRIPGPPLQSLPRQISHHNQSSEDP